MTKRTTVSEGYRSHANRGNETVLPRFTADVDLLIGASWSDSLGVLLYRLAREYDAVCAEVRRTSANKETALTLSLMYLKTLHETKDAVGRHAIQMATREGFMERDSVVLALTGRVLLAWLEPDYLQFSCLGHKGGDGQTVTSCSSCRRSETSREMLGSISCQSQFCQMLLSDMDTRTRAVDSELARLIRVTK